MRIRQTAGSLLQGVSQQPASQRPVGFADSQDNYLSSPTEGLLKRHPLEHVKLLTACTGIPRQYHLRNRDTTERYIIGAGNESVRVWDLEGDEATVIGQSSDVLLDGSDFTTTNWTLTNAEAYADYTTAPDGTKTASELVDSSVAATGTITQTIPAASLNDGEQVVWKIRLKDHPGGPYTADEVRVRLYQSGGAGTSKIDIDLTTGATIAVTSGNKALVEALEDGWYLLSAVLTYDVTDGDGDLIFEITPAYGVATDRSRLYAWQAEVGDNKDDFSYLDLRQDNPILDPEDLTTGNWTPGAEMTVTASEYTGPFCDGLYTKLAADANPGGGGDPETEPATNPSPADAATGIGLTATLAWTGPAPTHAVYFGTAPSPGAPELQGSQVGTSFDPGALTGATTYYWRIDEEYASGTITGDIWSFTTAASSGTGKATDPSPADAATAQDIEVDIAWAGDAPTHDVYFGTTATPGAPELQGNQVGKVYDPGVLDYSTTYYWRIDEVYGGGTGTVTGDVWSFSTKANGGTGTDPGGAGDITAPPLAPVDPNDADYEVQDSVVAGAGAGPGAKGKWIRLSDGFEASDNNPTARAVEDGGPGILIRMNSPNRAADQSSEGIVYGGASASQSKVASYAGTPWQGQKMSFTIVGMNYVGGQPVDWMGTIGIDNSSGTGVEDPVVDGARFTKLLLQQTAGSGYVVTSPLGHTSGRVTIDTCDFVGNGLGPTVGDPEANFGGQGIKWGIRARGRVNWDVRDNFFGGLRTGGQPSGSLDIGGLQEHCMYVDGPIGDSVFKGNDMVSANRTMLQIVNRKDEQDAAGGGPGYGTFLIEDNFARGIGYPAQPDGSAFSIYGFLGTVVLRNNSVLEVSGQTSAGGALVAVPNHDKGSYLIDDAYVIERLVIHNFTVAQPHMSRGVAQITGVKTVEIYDFDFVDTNGKKNIELDGEGFDGVDLGLVYPTGSLTIYQAAPCSGYAGWTTAVSPINYKMWFQDTELSDAEIDAYGGGLPAPAPPSAIEASVSQTVGVFLDGDQYFACIFAKKTNQDSTIVRLSFVDLTNDEEHYANFIWFLGVLFPLSKSSGISAFSAFETGDGYTAYIKFNPDDSTITSPGDSRQVMLSLETQYAASQTFGWVFGAWLWEGSSPPAYLKDVSKLKMLSLADYTFISNGHKTTLLDVNQTAPVSATEEEFFLFVKQGNYLTNYIVDIEAGPTATDRIVVATYAGENQKVKSRCVGAEGATSTACSTAGGTWVDQADILLSIDTDVIAESIRLQLNALTVGTATFTATRSGSVVRVTAGNKVKKLNVSDTMGDTALLKIHESVPIFSDLPLTCVHDTIIRVDGEPVEGSGDPEAFYVKFVADAKTGFGNGHWEETLAPGAITSLDGATMPHQLVRYQDDQKGTYTGVPYSIYFVWGPATWDDRVAGNDDTNGAPSFVNNTISDLFFFKHRLGFLTEDRIVMSEVDRYFNVWRTTVMALPDSDRLDVASSFPEVVEFDAAVPMQEHTILFADRAQFTFSGEPLLTPTTASIKAVTSFECLAARVRPELVGGRIFFADPLGSYSGLREFYQLGDSDKYDALEATAQIPKYISGAPETMASSVPNNVLLVKTVTDNANWYVYKFLWNGQDQAQSCWSRYVFGDGNDFKWFDFVDSVLYTMIVRDDGLHLEKMSWGHGLTDSGYNFVTRLDHRVAGLSLIRSYSEDNDETTFTLPYEVDASWTIECYNKDGTPYVVSSATGSTVVVTGDVLVEATWLGVRYDAEYVSPIQNVRDREQRAVAARRLQPHRFYLEYVDSRAFSATVSAPNRTGSEKTFSSDTLASGLFNIPINRKNATLTLKNTTPLPSTFLNAEWDTEYVPRNNRP